MRIAIVDDDPAEHMILREIGASVRGDAEFEGFSSLDAFLHAGPGRFDVVFLDRRLPPYETFGETLPAIAATGYAGGIVLMTAAVPQSRLDGFAFRVCGPVDKIALIDPACLAAYIDEAARGSGGAS
jgi:DNA-binding LytR/AlgR family response regulator